MVKKEIITEIINNLNNNHYSFKCGRKQIESKLSKLSDTEKRTLLKDKLNEGEWKEYDLYSDWCSKIKDTLEEYDDYTDDDTIRVDFEFFKDVDDLRTTLNNRLKRWENILYNYNKRIFQDYKLDKNPVPKINKDDFKVSDNGDRYGTSNTLSPIEEKQINLQDEINYTDFEKQALSLWWGSFHREINESLYGTLASYDLKDADLMKLLKNTKRGMTQAIRKSPPLSENSVLFHGGRFDISLNPGDHMTFKGFTSLSFNRGSAGSFDNGPHKFMFVCYTPAGVKGVCGNSRKVDNGHATEHEYLTDKGLGATILSVDYEHNIVEVLIDEP